MNSKINSKKNITTHKPLKTKTTSMNHLTEINNINTSKKMLLSPSQNKIKTRNRINMKLTESKTTQSKNIINKKKDKTPNKRIYMTTSNQNMTKKQFNINKPTNEHIKKPLLTSNENNSKPKRILKNSSSFSSGLQLKNNLNRPKTVLKKNINHNEKVLLKSNSISKYKPIHSISKFQSYRNLATTHKLLKNINNSKDKSGSIKKSRTNLCGYMNTSNNLSKSKAIINHSTRLSSNILHKSATLIKKLNNNLSKNKFNNTHNNRQSHSKLVFSPKPTKSNKAKINENPKIKLKNNSTNSHSKKNLEIITSPFVIKKNNPKINKTETKFKEDNNINNKKIKSKNIIELKENNITNKEDNKPHINISMNINNNIIVNHIENQNSIIRRISKIDSCSLAGYSSPNIQKINQDNFFIEKNFFENDEQFYVGVCDGHGSYGHVCSDFISNHLPDYLNIAYKQNKASLSMNTIIIDAFISFNNELINETYIDSSFSGSTCVSIIFLEDRMLSVNLGDSRAVMAKYVNNAYITVPLSRDHKPNEKEEAKKIEDNEGQINAYYDEESNEYIGPLRIWVKGKDYPGLAMTRSFGDQIAHSVGVSSEPEIKEFKYDGTENFVIIASDGVWEFIENEEAVEIVQKYFENNMDANGAVNALVKEAFKRWKKEEEIVDDITALVIFFE